MAPAIHTDSDANDPLLPWLRKIKQELDNWHSGKSSDADLNKLVINCISTFKNNSQYQNDIRFLKIWFLYIDGAEDYESIFREMEEMKICIGHSCLYEWYALVLEVKGELLLAYQVYQTGISRSAEPLESLRKSLSLFVQRMAERVNASSVEEVDKTVEFETFFVNPWETSTLNDLMKKINSQMMKYDGYHQSKKPYSGKVALSSLHNTPRNKVIEIGGKNYQIKGLAGKGGFAQVFKACVNSDPDDVVALKIQKPPFSWEFYMYRQLDRRVKEKQRPSFGFAHRMHAYTDYSILVCDFLSHGTLQDVINSYVVMGKFMEEVLCIYYTMQMLYMLETLHNNGIIHGDFKPDNLLLRHSGDDLTEEGFGDQSGPWSNQGLCLVDWGRGIDLHLFPENTEFKGDCRTSGFRCIQMKENKPWTYQVDTYGLCVIVHMMLHNQYLEVEKKDGSNTYLPRSSFKRYWNTELWKNLYTTLLNPESCKNDSALLHDLRVSFQEYITSNPQLFRKLKELLVKQRALFCSSK